MELEAELWRYLQQRYEVVGCHLVEIPFDLTNSLAPRDRNSVEEWKSHESFPAHRHRLERGAVLEHRDERAHSRQRKEHSLEGLVYLKESLSKRRADLLGALQESTQLVGGQVGNDVVLDHGGSARTISTSVS